MKMNKLFLSGVLIAMTAGSLSAQSYPRFVRSSDKAKLTDQAQSFYKVADPLVKDVSNSVVVIKAGNKTVSLGTVTDKGIVTKFSEISKLSEAEEVRMIAKDGKAYPVNLLNVYESYDIALLENVGKLPAVDLKGAVTPEVGAFLVASGASEEALAMGVVSVKPRSLKQKDRGFLGVIMNMNSPKGGGVLLNVVEPGSAASKAGLLKGDVILAIDGESVSNMLEMRNFLQQQIPGEEITISYKRGDVVNAGVTVTLGAREEYPQVRSSRMNNMKRMGGRISSVSEGFPQVLQSDIQVKSHFCGAPLVDINGDFVGVVVAKASRIKSYIIEGNKLEELLNSVPDR